MEYFAPLTHIVVTNNYIPLIPLSLQFFYIIIIIIFYLRQKSYSKHTSYILKEGGDRTHAQLDGK